LEASPPGAETNVDHCANLALSHRLVLVIAFAGAMACMEQAILSPMAEQTSI
jgi:hypothetical protein